VISQPSTSEELVDETLTVLSDVFFADVTCLAKVVGGRLLVTGSCGLAEDDPALQDGWPLSVTAAEVAKSGRAATRMVSGDREDVPASLARLGLHTAAWVPLTDSPDVSDLLILYRRSDDPFTQSDLDVLGSVAHRLHLAVEERERGVVIERLAQSGHRLARHLELEPLLDEAVVLLAELTGASSAWVVILDGDQAQPRVHRGLSPPDTGNEQTQAALCVPVVRDNVEVALLCAAREHPRPFAKDAVEIVTIFANYLAVAMANAELYRVLQQRASQDPLTGLANRVVVGQCLEGALAQIGPTHVGLLFCDLDKFKAVNDRLGHEAGDELLQQVAGRLRSCLRPSDLLARFGGDEFVVVLDGITELGEVGEVGRRLLRALDSPFVLRGEAVYVSASIGGVLGMRGETTASAMLRDADAAMYAAKDKGIGLVEVFDDAASHRSLDRLDIRSELLRALDRDQLSLRYQPIFELGARRIVGFEALLRWHHPQRGAVPRDVFIPLAEETGAIVPIGRWVLREACRQLATWRRLAPTTRIGMHVNVSTLQLRQPQVARHMLTEIRAAGVEPSDIHLEVTEHSYLRDDVTEHAMALHAVGLHFALDDFGTAYANLSYLRRFPIDTIKIDRSFVAGVADRDPDRSIVRAVLAIADSLSLEVVAEGVETEEQRTALLALGCRRGQGRLLSRPLPPADATALLLATPPIDRPTGPRRRPQDP
jgi:diguanylate cyclase (GGDEF)-like protein